MGQWLSHHLITLLLERLCDMMAALPLLLSVFWPAPRQVDVRPEMLLRLPVRVEAPASLSRPAVLLRREVAGLFGAPTGKAAGTVVRLSLAPDALSRPEEYSLETGNGQILLRAHDEQGAFWAVHSLMQLLAAPVVRRTPEGFHVPGARVRDWPETPFRAFMIQGAWTRSAADFRRNLDLMARMKIRYFALEFGPQVVLDFDPSIAQGGKYSKAQAKEIIAYGRSLGMEPIGYLNLLGHLDRGYQKAPYTDHGGLMIQNDETYERFVHPILSEMLDVYGPIQYFHCGMDEAWELFSWFSEQKMDGAGLLVRHIRRVNDFLKARGVRLVIWHDMFLAPELRKALGAPIGPANGGPPQNSAAALAELPKDVILDYWFYDPLEAYPALDYLKAQGFALWASPWQTPFGLTRYALARQVPSLGTLWSGPPGCFSSPTFRPVTALYAQAAWNPAAAPAGPHPEPEVAAAADMATRAVLWSRRTLSLGDPARALVLTPGAPDKPAVLAWPAAAARAPEQAGGVPFDFSRPARFPALPGRDRALEQADTAAFVLLPGGSRLALDGVNAPRAENQVILYAAPRTETGTNIYGAEVAVSATGDVMEIADYGAGNHAVPAGGFVLSAHLGNRPEKANRLLRLRVGDRLAVLDAAGNWLGGYEPPSLKVELPGGVALPISGVDRARNAGELLLYQPGYNGGRTGTNEFGVEVCVAGGKALAVAQKMGSAAIPAEGFVLSAHGSEAGSAAAALAGLHAGDAVRLLLSVGGKEDDLAGALAERQWSAPVRGRCRTLFLSAAAERSTAPGTVLGAWVVTNAAGTRRRIPVRYAEQVLPVQGEEVPHTLSESVWLARREGEPRQCAVLEWQNPEPGVALESLSFEPAPAALEVGYRVLGVTAALER